MAHVMDDRRPPRGWRSLVSVAALVLACAGGGNVAPRGDYAAAVDKLAEFIEHEMDDKGLPALSIALVDDQETVWAHGFGMARPEDGVPASAATVYRVGSVSKLFTDLGMMQLVESGAIDLDAPVTEYLPEFRPANPFGVAPTLRQLTSHRSGLVREPPVGHYFDDTGPTLAATVESLNGTAIVYEPASRTKYSNAGIATVGYVLERLRGEAFGPYLRRAVLEPLGMAASSFQPDPPVVERLATAFMWTYDGRTFEAPTFQLGMAPAGSMYAPVTDLARFLSALFAGGVGPGGRVVAEETLDTMLTPQFAPAGAASGYGIGFRLGPLDGERSVGHGGAIYGFATDLTALPDRKLGAVSVTTLDGANTVVARINQYALRLMMAVRDGGPLPDPVITRPVPDSVAAGLAGRFGAGESRVEIARRGDVLQATFADRRERLRSLDGAVVTDGRLGFGRAIAAVEGGLLVDGARAARAPDEIPPPPPPRWGDLIGEYGWDYNTLYVFERDGQLHALIEWFYIDPLTEVEGDLFAFPNRGLYHGEQLRFRRGPDGAVTGVEAAGIRFPRRAVGTEAGVTFTIDPVRPVEELRAEALAATPPAEDGAFRDPDLVELRSLDATIAYDIRYATTNNFMQSEFYDEPRALLQRPAAEALVRAHRTLGERGYGLLIHDAYRPWYVTKMFWDATPEALKDFVANPANGSRHNRGAAVDLTLFDRATGEPVEMVGGYDEFSDRSFPEYLGGTSRQRWHRELLRGAMEAEGFAVYEFEWWHFDYADWARYPILNLVFSDLEP